MKNSENNIYNERECAMIKDLDLFYDLSPLFERKLILLGTDVDKKNVISEMMEMGAGKHGITICDWNPHKWNKKIDGIGTVSPYLLKNYLQSTDTKKFSLCIVEEDLKEQDKILNELDKMEAGELNVYTDFGINGGIYYGLNSEYIGERYRQKRYMEKAMQVKRDNARMELDALKYFAFMPLHDNEMILIFQPGKVGSRTVHYSIENYGRNVLHIHYLHNYKYYGTSMREVVQSQSGKIISMVREPVSRAISSMWFSMESFCRNKHNFVEIEKDCFNDRFEYFQEEWYNSQMKKIFGIDILEYPFDREKGYQIIKSENIEVLLLKMECLDKLESVIGEFVGIQDFRLCKSNTSEVRPYRFAYQEYKKKFSMPVKRLEAIYKRNEFVKHFYTEEECEQFLFKYNKG